MWPEFVNSWWLLLLALVPLLLWWSQRLRRPSLRFPHLATLAALLPAARTKRARRSGLVLRGAALVFLSVGLAGSRWPDSGTRIRTEGIALLMVVDVSGSMGEPDFSWQGLPTTRFEAVQRTFRLFVEGGDSQLTGRKHDLIGLVTFAKIPESTCPLTLSHESLLRLLDAERPRVDPDEGRTNVGDAIAWALHRLEHIGERRKVMILLTDGEHNVADVLKPRQAAQLAGNLGVAIYTIDVGRDPPHGEGEAKGQSIADRLAAKKSLQEVARMTGGYYFQAGDTQALLDIYARIDQLERQPIETFQYRRYYEAYPWFGLLAFGCLALILGLELTVWLRVP